MSTLLTWTIYDKHSILNAASAVMCIHCKIGIAACT